ncbi:MAG: hypothetical protein ASARMPREDX12_008272 [Alectoria sarmentosa]|nr:MAG: hypothetical protein ASARMPREDX12_008272 [Alectoria sarmentosa]
MRFVSLTQTAEEQGAKTTRPGMAKPEDPMGWLLWEAGDLISQLNVRPPHPPRGDPRLQSDPETIIWEPPASTRSTTTALSLLSIDHDQQSSSDNQDISYSFLEFSLTIYSTKRAAHRLKQLQHGLNTGAIDAGSSTSLLTRHNAIIARLAGYLFHERGKNIYKGVCSTVGSTYDAAVQLIYKLPGKYRLIRQTHHTHIVQGTPLAYRDLVCPSHGTSEIILRGSSDRDYEMELVQTTIINLRTWAGLFATKIEKRAFRIRHGHGRSKNAAFKKLDDDLAKAQKTIRSQSDQTAGVEKICKANTTPQRFNLEAPFS